MLLWKPEIAWMKSSFTAAEQYTSVSSLVCILCAEEWLQQAEGLQIAGH